MKTIQKNIRALFFWTLMICCVLVSSNTLGEEINLPGEPVTDNTLDEIHGGFLSSIGDFIYFSIDVLQVRSWLHGSPENLGSDNFINLLHQRAYITEEGIGVELDIAQNGINMGENALNFNGNTIPQNQVSFMNNFGIVNANVINGNYNSAAITNVINIELNVFQVKDTTGVGSIFRNLTLH